MTRSRRYERGNSLPETAIVMAVVLMLVFGIIDFGRAMYTYSFVANTARQGARWAIVRGSQCTLLDHCGALSADVQTYVRSLSVGITDPNSITATAAFPGNGPGCSGAVGTSGVKNVPGCPVVVSVTYNSFKFILPYMPGPTISMSSTSQMIISQ